ncbi:MAG: hypothetical protein ACRDNM_05770, partial [Gaiellaceae bacterium]
AGPDATYVPFASADDTVDALRAALGETGDRAARARQRVAEHYSIQPRFERLDALLAPFLRR